MIERVNAMLALSGERGNTVAKYNLTPGEVMVLRAIHGQESVFDVEPVEADKEMNGRQDLERLRSLYGQATDGNLRHVIDRLFPGAGAKVPEKMADVELPDDFYKPTARAKGNKPKEALPVRKTAATDEDGIRDL